jgi:hypothetical protein
MDYRLSAAYRALPIRFFIHLPNRNDFMEEVIPVTAGGPNMETLCQKAGRQSAAHKTCTSRNQNLHGQRLEESLGGSEAFDFVYRPIHRFQK